MGPSEVLRVRRVPSAHRLRPTTISGLIWTSKHPSGASANQNPRLRPKSFRNEPNRRSVNRIADMKRAVETSGLAKDARATKLRPASRKKPLRRVHRTSRTRTGTRSRTGNGAKSGNRHTNRANHAAEADVGADLRAAVVAGAAAEAIAVPLGANLAAVGLSAARDLAAESLVPRRPDKSKPAKKGLVKNDRHSARTVTDPKVDLDREVVVREVGIDPRVDLVAKDVARSGPGRKVREARGVRPNVGHNGLRDRNRPARLRKRRMKLTTLEPGCSTRAALRHPPRMTAARGIVSRAPLSLVTIGMNLRSRRNTMAAILRPIKNARTATGARKAKTPRSWRPNGRRRKVDAHRAGDVEDAVHVRDEDLLDRWIGRAL